ncbi:hypothetical protein [Williamsia phyllosphaerae]|uniref:Uncharacterized protein n=1 Tax=Williamsia phyllosphaerae TaxID=885042 RepID=A0ABQ1U2G4_9NOCA|nr:hypothetical protein [Williamsia phyllosphaerae]GGF08205.1 hypothetical protein GCM10007298_00140 [Williamsia phyllosphaerae]
MADDDGSVLSSLGIDGAEEYSIPDSVWDAALAAAFDPDAPTADAALVPEMDDDGDVPVDAGDDPAEAIHHGGDDHPADHATDGAPHDDPPHDDATIDLGGHDVGDHPSPGHDHHDDHATDHDWHG